jgi:Tubulin like
MSTSDDASQNEPHCTHVIGIGRTGAVYVEALLRTGEIEDNLTRDGTMFAALLVDIGDDDIQVANDYARAFKSRLLSRKVAAEKFDHESVVFATPDAAAFAKKLEAVRPLYTTAGGEDLLPELPKAFDMPKPGEHTPRAIAKAIAAFGSYLDDKPLAGALYRFADQVKRASCKSTVLVAFSLAGGTGSGMAFDIARKLGTLGLGDAVRIVGVGQLSHSGDGDYENSVAQTMTIDDLDRAASGPAAKNPFPGGCFIVSTEHSWQRLTAYTTTGLKEVRQHFKQLVTNRFVADSFMRWAVSDGSAHLVRVLDQSAGKCILFNVAKFSHPGVQVLPGQPRSTWDAVLQQWVHFVPKYFGLNDGFKADYIEAHIFTARNMYDGMIADELKTLLTSGYMKKANGHYHAYTGEFFDELTSYADIIVPGVGKGDLSAYKHAGEQEKTGKLGTLEQV